MRKTKPKSELIEKFCRRYKNEWLLIDVDQVDKHTRAPKTGRLLLHSQRKDDLSHAFVTGRGHLYRLFSGPVLPPGFHAAF